MRDCDYALAWKIADRFPELPELFVVRINLAWWSNDTMYNNYWTRWLQKVVISQCLADQLFTFAFNLLGDWPAGWPADRLNDQLTNGLVDRLT